MFETIVVILMIVICIFNIGYQIGGIVEIRKYEKIIAELKENIKKK